MKRAQYFITCKGKAMPYVKIDRDYAGRMLIADSAKDNFKVNAGDISQISFFDMPQLNDSFIEKKRERVSLNV